MRAQLTVNIDPYWVNSFRKSGMRLCCSFGVNCSGSDTEFNVITWAEAPTPINTISFTDDYFIAACKHGIEDGSLVAPNTEPIPMQLGESFTVQNDWTTAMTTSSESPIANAIRFLPATTASAILLKYVRNRITPFYVAGMRTEPLPPGKYTLTPSGNVCVFFMAQEACTAFKVTNIPTRSYLFRYQGQEIFGDSSAEKEPFTLLCIRCEFAGAYELW